jgi:hypothetical protein
VHGHGQRLTVASGTGDASGCKDCILGEANAPVLKDETAFVARGGGMATKYHIYFGMALDPEPLCGSPSHYYRHLGTSINLINNGIETSGMSNYEKTAIRLVAHDTG